MRSFVPRALVGVGVICLAAASVRAADPAAPESDPWNGKPRAEVVRLLGEPDKAKVARDGRETLTYAFERLAPDAPPHPEVMLLHVPGIGIVARVDRSRSAETLEIEPPAYDEAGRAVGGGLTRTTKASSSYDPKSGELTESPELLDKPRVTGKVKLRLSLAPDGRVESWSASGKE